MNALPHRDNQEAAAFSQRDRPPQSVRSTSRPALRNIEHDGDGNAAANSRVNI